MTLMITANITDIAAVFFEFVGIVVDVVAVVDDVVIVDVVDVVVCYIVDNDELAFLEHFFTFSGGFFIESVALFKYAVVYIGLLI